MPYPVSLIFNAASTDTINQLNVRKDMIEFQFREGLPILEIQCVSDIVLCTGWHEDLVQFPILRGRDRNYRFGGIRLGAEVYAKIGMDTEPRRHISIARILNRNPHCQHGIFEGIGNFNSERERILATDIGKVLRIK